MSVYVIAQSRVTDAEKLGQYAAAAGPSIAAHGGQVIGYADAPEVIEGDVKTPRTVILRYESIEAFRAWYDSPEYQEALPLRLESTEGTLIVVNGLD